MQYLHRDREKFITFLGNIVTDEYTKRRVQVFLLEGFKDLFMIM